MAEDSQDRSIRSYLDRIPEDRAQNDSIGIGNFYKRKYADDKNVLGVGGERIVINDGENAVALVYDGDKYIALTTYYIQQILHTLYPHNFPAFKAVYYSKEHDVNIEFRETITYESDFNSNDPTILSLDTIINNLSSMGLAKLGGNGTFGGEYIYPHFKNSGLVTDSQSGKKYEVFLDAVKPFGIRMNTWDFQKLYESMKQQNYPLHHIKTVLKASLRISENSQEKLDLINAHTPGEEMPPSNLTPNILNNEQINFIRSVIDAK